MVCVAACEGNHGNWSLEKSLSPSSGHHNGSFWASCICIHFPSCAVSALPFKWWLVFMSYKSCSCVADEWLWSEWSGVSSCRSHRLYWFWQMLAARIPSFWSIELFWWCIRSLYRVACSQAFLPNLINSFGERLVLFLSCSACHFVNYAVLGAL